MELEDSGLTEEIRQALASNILGLARDFTGIFSSAQAREIKNENATIRYVGHKNDSHPETATITFLDPTSIGHTEIVEIAGGTEGKMIIKHKMKKTFGISYDLPELDAQKLTNIQELLSRAMSFKNSAKHSSPDDLIWIPK